MTSPARRRRLPAVLFCLVVAALGLAAARAYLSRPLRPPADCLPAAATFASRHLDAAPRLPALLENPLLRSALAASGADLDSIDATLADPIVRSLLGTEAWLAYVPPAPSRAPALYGVASVGFTAFSLQSQLRCFRPDGYTPLSFPSPAPARRAWLVSLPDLPPPWRLAIAFRRGLVLAALSPDPAAIDALLLAADARAPALAVSDSSFAEFAAAPADRASPDRAWSRLSSGPLLAEAPALTASSLAFRASLPPAIFPPFATWSSILDALSAASPASPPPPALPPDAVPDLAALLRDAPCALLSLPRPALSTLAQIPDLDPSLAFAARMALVASPSTVLAAVLDGSHSGHLSWGPMRSWGLSGFRVPTLLLATPAPDGPEPLLKNLSTVCDLANRRYAGTFSVRPLPAPYPVWLLAASDPAEWVNQRPQPERPAAAFLRGWFLIASNLEILQKIAARAADPAPAALPGWADALSTRAADSPAPAAFWIHPPRALATTLDLLHTWTLLARFLPLEPLPPDLVPTLESVRKTWTLPPSASLALSPDPASPASPSIALQIP